MKEISTLALSAAGAIATGMNCATEFFKTIKEVSLTEDSNGCWRLSVTGIPFADQQYSSVSSKIQSSYEKVT